MARLTDNDRHFGPITYARSSWNPLRIVWSSGGDEEDRAMRNTLTAYAFGWVVQVNLPNLIHSFQLEHTGKYQYTETFPREYGFSLCDGFLQLFLGAQTHDSLTTQMLCAHLPWTQW